MANGSSFRASDSIAGDKSYLCRGHADSRGTGGIYAGTQYAHIVNRLTEWAHAVIYSDSLFYELHEFTLIKPYGRKVRNWRILVVLF